MINEPRPRLSNAWHGAEGKSSFKKPNAIYRLSWRKAIAFLLVLSLSLSAYTYPPHRASNSITNPIPVLAYYYIWFDPSSWDRAKMDYPLLGRYSSDDAEVMLQHIRWAKASGIDGFIVSWKSTDKLNRRLSQLIKLANQENFKLGIIYQGLNYSRDPLPISQVSTDLDYFIDHYADNPAFKVFEKPMVIWSGTWEFSPEEIQSVTEGKRDHLLILASEKNVKGYERLADVVDGDAYYWSSVNPDTHPGHPEKLNSMGESVHAHRGLWIAPAAPGYDSHLLGGRTIVKRNEGETLRREMSAAFQSSPDAVGLISWNEFSENSHLEPSVNYGVKYLKVLAVIEQAPGPSVSDSGAPADNRKKRNLSQLVALSLLGILAVGLFAGIGRTHHKNSGSSHE